MSKLFSNRNGLFFRAFCISIYSIARASSLLSIVACSLILILLVIPTYCALVHTMKQSWSSGFLSEGAKLEVVFLLQMSIQSMGLD